MLYGWTAEHTGYITIVMSTLEILTCSLSFHNPSLSCLKVLGIIPEFFFLMAEADLMDQINKRVSVSYVNGPCSCYLETRCGGFFVQDVIGRKDVQTPQMII